MNKSFDSRSYIIIITFFPVRLITYNPHYVPSCAKTMILFQLVFILVIHFGGISSSSNKLESWIEDQAEIGSPLRMYCKVPQELKHSIVDCGLKRPETGDYDDTITIIHGRKFVDENPPGFQINRSDPNSCDVTIESFNDSDIGDWACVVKLNNVRKNQISILTAKLNTSVIDMRLPRHAVPEQYTTTLSPSLKESNFTVTGHIDIDAHWDPPAMAYEPNNITLHIRDIIIDEDSVKVPGYDITAHGYDSLREYYIIFLRKKQTRTSIKVSMDFEYELNTDGRGFYRSSYNDVNGTQRWFAITQFEAVEARMAMPCMDEPDLKAKFSLSLGHDSNMMALSNMPAKENRNSNIDNEEYIWTSFEDTESMSSYLMAFMVSDFECKPGIPTNNDVRFRICSRPELIEQTDLAAQNGPKILEYYENFFNISFPLPKQDLIADPSKSGAMENWGMITYGEDVLLYEEGVSSLTDQERVIQVMAHEIAHQWFGDLVTMKWWTE